jgi:hypothetical protein
MNAKQCEQRAEECLAHMRTATGSSRETFLYLARTWRDLAEQARLYEQQHGDPSGSSAGSPETRGQTHTEKH